MAKNIYSKKENAPEMYGKSVEKYAPKVFTLSVPSPRERESLGVMNCEAFGFFNPLREGTTLIGESWS